MNKPETDRDFEKGASLKAIDADETPADGSVPSGAKVSRPIYCDELARFLKADISAMQEPLQDA